MLYPALFTLAHDPYPYNVTNPGVRHRLRDKSASAIATPPSWIGVTMEESAPMNAEEAEAAWTAVVVVDVVVICEMTTMGGMEGEEEEVDTTEEMEGIDDSGIEAKVNPSGFPRVPSTRETR